MQKNTKEWMIQMGTRVRRRINRAMDAVRHFSIRQFWQELLQSLKEELYPFSWKKGLRYYRRPLVVLLVFCVLWAAPVVAANTMRDTMFFWWPDYVVMPLITEKKRVEFFVPSLERNAMFEFSQASTTNWGEKFNDYKLYSNVQDGIEMMDEYYHSESLREGPPIICKVKVLQTRDFYSSAVFENQWNEDEWILRGHRMIANVLLEDVIFDPYNYYEDNDKLLISPNLSFDDFGKDDRLYLFFSHPLLPGDADTTYYDLGFVDNSSHFSSWYIREEDYMPEISLNSVIFWEGEFNERGIPVANKMGHKMEIYTEEQIDEYLYKNLTVYEDYWKEHAKGRLAQ